MLQYGVSRFDYLGIYLVLPLVVAQHSAAPQVPFELVGSHLRVIVPILAALRLEAELASAVQIPIILVSARHEDVVVPIVAIVVHSVVEAVLWVVRSQPVEVFVVVKRLHVVQLSVEVVLSHFLFLNGLRVLRVAEFSFEVV